MSEKSETPAIRPAVLADADGIAAILRALGWFAHLSDVGPADAEAIVREHLAACLRNDDHRVLVAAASHGAVIGYAAVHWLPYLMLPSAEGYVSEVFVRDDARGRGVGGALLEAIRAEAERRGVWKLNLLNVRARPSYERRFYAKNGWLERPEVANFILPIRMPRP